MTVIYIAFWATIIWLFILHLLSKEYDGPEEPWLDA